MSIKKGNTTYFFDIADGQWEGQFDFRIRDREGFRAAKLGPIDRILANMLSLIGDLPGRARMYGEILGDPGEGDAGVARVSVKVVRFGLEIYRLSGYYALDPDGASSWITIHERIGPKGSPLSIIKSGRGRAEPSGMVNRYAMPLLGERWMGKYRISEDRTSLQAVYANTWGELVESMRRVGPPRPRSGLLAECNERLLNVARLLERIERSYQETRDPRSVFAGTYATTSRILAASFADTKYNDPAWVATLAESFVEHFLQALETYGGPACPRGWARVFKILADEPLTPIGQIVLPMIVHIAHDLPRALVESQSKASLPAHVGPEDRAADFHLVNDVLRASVDRIQDHLGAYSPVVSLLDGLGGRYDEALTSAAVTAGRALAWYHADLLRSASTSADAARSIDESVDRYIDLFLGRTRPIRTVLRTARRAAEIFSRTPSSERLPTLKEQIKTIRGESAFDPSTLIFSASVSAVFYAPYEEIRDMIDPDRWDECIAQVTSTEYVEPLVGGKGVLREQVNVLRPLLDRPEFTLTQLLDVHVQEDAVSKRVDYSLKKSLDGSLSLDDGFISVEKRSANISVVRFEKRLRVARNLPLFWMLRIHPAGLGSLFANWIGTAATTGSVKEQGSSHGSRRLNVPK